ncbi:ATP-grasp domain-containing protein [Alkalihalobacterium bogoriense]|uniref:ATP-grasp domain-containing protein n=1 Tax=Alkalihalobacterium bogoriense TaxID=246272 RepID=UPI000479971A|nr:hypothetical protein [Alkalihalobacterium bogoriense]
MTTRRYLSLIQQSVQKDGVTFKEIVPDYLYVAQKDNDSFLMHDVEIGLNNSASMKIAQSKSATYSVLAAHKVPAIEHVFLRNTLSRFATDDPIHQGRQWYSKWNQKVVVKPDTGAQGNHVYKIDVPEELDQKINTIFSLEYNVAISPFYEATYEYRIITLFQQPKLFIGKQRTTTWKHNLIGGAKPVAIAKPLQADLAVLAKKASTALQLDFCSIDILHTNNGLRVIEVNDQVMMDEYVKANPSVENEVAHVYREAILHRFHHYRPISSND